jgi:hypothetical protein
MDGLFHGHDLFVAHPMTQKVQSESGIAEEREVSARIRQRYARA